MGAHFRISPNSMFGFAKKRGVITTFACFATKARITSIKCAPSKSNVPPTMVAVVGRLYNRDHKYGLTHSMHNKLFVREVTLFFTLSTLSDNLSIKSLLRMIFQGGDTFF